VLITETKNIYPFQTDFRLLKYYDKTEKDETYGVCSTRREDEKCVRDFTENLKEIYDLADLFEDNKKMDL
jgi:hypothetical protein